jgi:signal peptidase I
MRLDFATVLVVLVFVCGIIWALDAWLWAPRRKLGATEGDAEPALPIIVEYARSFFPVFFIVLVLRSFLVEPFRIPSGSMVPTLLTGDFILVNKFAYGVRLPVTDHKLVALGTPERGDVVVFRYPEDQVTPYIKRVVGLPGDTVGYADKQVFLNGKPVPLARLSDVYAGTGSQIKYTGLIHFKEDLLGIDHSVLVDPSTPMSKPFEVRVPDGHYFVMGDNRDKSSDSRIWGFVPDENLIGKAFMIWMHFDWGHGSPEWNRIGNDI